jgi:hypothetical protein
MLEFPEPKRQTQKGKFTFNFLFIISPQMISQIEVSSALDTSHVAGVQRMRAKFDEVFGLEWSLMRRR